MMRCVQKLLLCSIFGIGLAAPAASSPRTPSLSISFGSSLTPAVIRACPVTLANGQNPPSAIRYGSPAPGYHGNGLLWIVLDSGKLLVPPEQRSLEYKFHWYRGIPGRLEIAGRRLDAPAPPLQAEIPSGYGDIGFQPSGVRFPSEGCWELIARVAGPQGQAQLRVVLLVIRRPFPPLEPTWRPLRPALSDADLSDLPHAIRLIYRPVLEEHERIWWGWEESGSRILEGVWSGWRAQQGIWYEVPVFSSGYGQLILETAYRSWSGGPPNPSGPVQRTAVHGRPARCIRSLQEDAAALIWEEGAFRYRILQWGLKLSCADLLRIAEGSSTPASGGKR